MRNFFAATNLMYHNIHYIDTRKLETKSLETLLNFMSEFGELAQDLCVCGWMLVSMSVVERMGG